ncbi:MAG: helix-turn-helix domain-containing protein [Chloroflexi bacterium]|nr:helix-turn-helix domain-containing protein [Chloroflexota bacterium]
MSFEPEDKFFITDVETLKVLADERRLQLLEILGHKSATVKELAQELDIPTNKLYYHIRLMEEHGIIQVVDTNIGPTQIVEKTYRASARRFMLDESLSPLESLDATLALIFKAIDSVKEELRENAAILAEEDPESKRGAFGKGKLYLTNAKAEQVARELGELWDRYGSEPDNPEAQQYTLMFTFIPTPKRVHIEEEDDEQPG